MPTELYRFRITNPLAILQKHGLAADTDMMRLLDGLIVEASFRNGSDELVFTVLALLDALGKYSSDVRTYWFDTCRSIRLTEFTLPKDASAFVTCYG